ncbi:hypothetical protein L1987_17112 [Smallanthus sonchifolius]|uniref:Uncharacterized protein n=1 Tax=Smallanthus sonchifolius TaxID=185202 RepID=A0ACB9IWW0_9ASTR|nr:hypothetical protein L1987_17112 [Smallanthus sonchifolius]
MFPMSRKHVGKSGFDYGCFIWTWRVDHLVCNAGIGPLYSSNHDVTKFVPVIDINFWCSVYPTHFAIPHLMKTKGKIIVNASSTGVLHPPKGGFYNASKAALISFYESLRFEGVGTRLRKDFKDVFPTMESEPCAKAIVEGVCKGATSITEPRFIKALFLIKFLFPQLHSFYFNIFALKD